MVKKKVIKRGGKKVKNLKKKKKQLSLEIKSSIKCRLVYRTLTVFIVPIT